MSKKLDYVKPRGGPPGPNPVYGKKEYKEAVREGSTKDKGAINPHAVTMVSKETTEIKTWAYYLLDQRQRGIKPKQQPPNHIKKRVYRLLGSF
jgi:hypothetical protein